MSPLPWPLIGRTRRKRLVRVADLPAPAHTGGNVEDCGACRPLIDQPGGVLYPWVCPGEPAPEKESGEWTPRPPIPTDPPTGDMTNLPPVAMSDVQFADRCDGPFRSMLTAEDEMLAELAAQDGDPWEAARRLFADDAEETGTPPASPGGR